MIQDECFRKYLAEVEKTGKLKNKELYRLALHNDKRAIKHIPYDEQTAEMALMAVKHCPRYLRFVAPQLKTHELCLLAVQTNANALLYVPDELQTPELCRFAISKNHKTLKYVSNKLRTEELCKFALSQLLAQAHVFDSGYLWPFQPTIKYVPFKQRNLELFKFMLYSFKQKYGKALKPDFLGLQIRFAVRWWDDIGRLVRINENQDFLKGVPKDEQTEQVFISALTEENKKYYSKTTDEKVKTREEWLLVISKNSDYFRRIPREIITEDFCKLALSTNVDVAEFIPNVFWTDEFVLSVIKDNLDNSKLTVRLLAYHTPQYFFDNVVHYELAKKSYKVVLQENGLLYQDLPEKIQCEELALIALKSCTSHYGQFEVFKSIADLLKTKEICWLMLQSKYQMLDVWCLIPSIHKDDVMCHYVIEQGVLLVHIPSSFITTELCLLAISRNLENIRYIPDSLKTDKLCMLLLEKYEKTAIFYVLEKFQTIHKILLHANHFQGITDFLKHLPKKYQNDDFCLQLLKVDDFLFAFLPIQLKTEVVCCYAVRLSLQNIRFVPDEIKKMTSMLVLIQERFDYCMHVLGVGSDIIKNLKYIPEQFVTLEFCELAVKTEATALQYIPNHFKTPEMCWQAVSQNSNALQFVP